MIIGYDGSRAFSLDRTGTENYSYQLLVHLAKIDKKNKYIVYIRPHSVPDSKKWPDNFTFVVISYPYLWTQVGLALHTFRDSLDLLFVPAHTVPLFHKPKLKTIMTVHDLGAEYLPQMHQLKQILYLGWISRFQMRSCTRLIAVSNATKRDLIRKLGISGEKIKVIYEGVGLIRNGSSVNKQAILNKFNLKRGEYILFVGTIQPRKNLKRLISAFANLIAKYPQIKLKLVLVGGRGWLSDQIYSLPKEKQIDNKVIFTGRVTDEELNLLYQCAQCFVYPSLFEGFGLPILEAFQNDCPVITSATSSMPEIAGNAALLVNPYNENEIESSMHTLVNSPKLRMKLIKEGRKRIKLFSWMISAKETLALFEEVSSG